MIAAPEWRTLWAREPDGQGWRSYRGEDQYLAIRCAQGRVAQITLSLR